MGAFENARQVESRTNQHDAERLGVVCRGQIIAYRQRNTPETVSSLVPKRRDFCGIYDFQEVQAQARSTEALRGFERRERAFNIDPPTSSNAIMRRQVLLLRKEQ